MDDSSKYLVRDAQGNVYGPADVNLLRQWVADGRIIAGMHIAPRNTDDWVEVSSHPALADCFPQAAGSVPYPGPATPAPATAANPYASTIPGSYPADQASFSNFSAPPKPNILGLISMIAGIVAVLGSLTSCLCICTGPLGFLIAIAALVMGLIALNQIKKAPELYTNRGMALAGAIMGAAALLLAIVGTVVQIIIISRS